MAWMVDVIIAPPPLLLRIIALSRSPRRRATDTTTDLGEAIKLLALWHVQALLIQKGHVCQRCHKAASHSSFPTIHFFCLLLALPPSTTLCLLSLFLFSSSIFLLSRHILCLFHLINPQAFITTHKLTLHTPTPTHPHLPSHRIGRPARALGDQGSRASSL